MRRHLFVLTQPVFLAPAAGVLAVATGGITMFGWLIGAEPLIRILPWLPPTKPNAALCFLLCGSALLLLCGGHADVGRRRAARAMALLAALVGGLTLAEYLTGWNPGLDGWIFRHAVLADSIPDPGRMTPAASLIFLLVGAALAWLDFQPRRGLFPAQHAACLASFLGLLDIVGYLYGVVTINGFYAHSNGALDEAVLFTCLALGVMMARPNQGLMSVATRHHGGGLMMRSLLPAIVLLPIILGWLLLRGEVRGWYDGKIGVSLLVVSNIVIFTIVLWFNARNLNRLDEKRRRAHESVVEGARGLRQANERLREEVDEHTRTEQARKRTERQLHQSQKMESLGTLAGGIAHDFNNILTAIFLNADRARKNLPEDHTVRRNLEEISKASARAADLVRRILAFGRQTEPHLKTVRLGQAVEESLQLLRLSVPTSVELRSDLGGDLPPVALDTTQVHQILLNLGTNAIHAMEDKGGVLEIKLDLVFVTPELARMLGDLKEGPHVRIAVRDTGKGMEKAVLDRIFDPFFTTKAPGAGTGLGLSVVHGIMKQHGGCVTAYSEPDRGTLFHLYFPALTADQGGEVYARPAIAHGKGERLLCIDDDVAILTATTEMLEGLGYAVTAFSDPQAALEALGAAPESFDLLLTDLSMPGMSGVDVARVALALCPGLPVVVMSGYVAPGDGASLWAAGVRAVVQKPNVLEELGTAIRRALSPSP